MFGFTVIIKTMSDTSEEPVVLPSEDDTREPSIVPSVRPAASNNIPTTPGSEFAATRVAGRLETEKPIKHIKARKVRT